MLDDTAIPTLPSGDLDITSEFYSGLGFSEISRHEAYLILRRDNIELHFFRLEDVDPLSSDHGCYIRASDVDSLHAIFSAAGLPEEGTPRISHAPADREWGIREFALVDPHGNLIRCGQRVVRATTPTPRS